MFRMARRSAKRTRITTESLETMGEYGQEVAEGGQDDHPRVPAVAIACSEQRSLAHNLDRGHSSG